MLSERNPLIFQDKLETFSFSVDYFVQEKVKYCFVMRAINY